MAQTLTVYERVTNSIVAALEKPQAKWKRPWTTVGNDPASPRNVDSKKPYRGINTLALWADAMGKGFTSGEWGTFNQWKSRDAKVRKGEKASYAVLWKFGKDGREGEDGEDAPAGRDRLLFTRAYPVFNADQVDGYERPDPVDWGDKEGERIERADLFFRSVGAKLKHGGNQAFYSPSNDSITMPKFQQFSTPADYYSVLSHEHTHWTGAESRLARDLGKRFGSDQYAMEELVAELGAAFLCGALAIENTPREDHAQYLASWLSVLKKDSRAIFTAASQAQKAADYMIEKAAVEVKVA